MDIIIIEMMFKHSGWAGQVRKKSLSNHCNKMPEVDFKCVESSMCVYLLAVA